jgi:hypothetical protein
LKLRLIGITLLGIMCIIVLVPSSYASNPVSQTCSNNTTATTMGSLSCQLGSPTSSGDIIVGIVTCEGCSINANPIINDSNNDVYHLFDSNCCGATGAAQITLIAVANISSSVSLKITGQIRDTVNRSFWAMSAYEVTGAITNISKYVVGYGSTIGGQSNINVASTTWHNSSSVIFEGADVNGAAVSCTNSTYFAVGQTSADNGACYSSSYPITFSPSTFPMGNSGTSFAEQVLIIPFIPAITTFTLTQTITGFVVPNFVNGVNSFSWLYFMIVVFVPMGEIIGVVTMDKRSNLDRNALIFIFLAMLLLDSIFGVMLNLITVAMPFVFGILFVVYLWKGRG